MTAVEMCFYRINATTIDAEKFAHGTEVAMTVLATVRYRGPKQEPQRELVVNDWTGPWPEKHNAPTVAELAASLASTSSLEDAVAAVQGLHEASATAAVGRDWVQLNAWDENAAETLLTRYVIDGEGRVYREITLGSGSEAARGNDR